jgi:hypothetical protein
MSEVGSQKSEAQFFETEGDINDPEPDAVLKEQINHRLGYAAGCAEAAMPFRQKL